MYSFLVNRSAIMRELLLAEGWREGRVDSPVDLAMWDRRAGQACTAQIQTFPRSATNALDNKRDLYVELARHGQASLMPATFPDVARIESSDLEASRLYFLKEIYSTAGKGIRCLRGDALLAEVASLRAPTRHIVQRNVADPVLLDGRKTTLRVFVVLLHDLSAYIYGEALGIIHSQDYDPADTDADVHVLHHAAKYFSYADSDFFAQTFPAIRESAYRTLRCYFGGLTGPWRKGTYQIFGFDYVIDTDLRPFLIEVNAYPNLWGVAQIEIDIKRQMLRDFLGLHVYPTLGEAEPAPGGFHLLNRSFHCHGCHARLREWTTGHYSGSSLYRAR